MEIKWNKWFEWDVKILYDQLKNNSLDKDKIEGWNAKLYDKIYRLSL